MAEMFKSRVKFSPGQQKEFIFRRQKTLRLGNLELSSLLKVSVRTLTDWKREKFLMPMEAVRMLSRRTKTTFPKVKLLKQFWYVEKGAKLGGLARYKKYGGFIGDPEIRKKRWFEWWEREGKYKTHIHNTPRQIKKPPFSSKLAEFIGIVLGDGGISKYQVAISLHAIDDLKYSYFVSSLVHTLFGIKPSRRLRKHAKVIDVVVSRIQLVEFCLKSGLCIGNKIRQQIDIPSWIKANLDYKIACVRGLIDTDGCFFIHKYKSAGKYYSYKKIGFTSRSFPLLISVSNILSELGIKNRLMGQYQVRIEAQESVKKYFSIIGSHNLKYMDRYSKLDI